MVTAAKRVEAKSTISTPAKMGDRYMVGHVGAKPTKVRTTTDIVDPKQG